MSIRAGTTLAHCVRGPRPELNLYGARCQRVRLGGLTKDSLEVRPIETPRSGEFSLTLWKTVRAERSLLLDAEGAQSGASGGLGKGEQGPPGVFDFFCWIGPNFLALKSVFSPRCSYHT